MKENGIRLATEAERMTSLEIAAVTGKLHKHVMEAIRKMEPAWLKVNGSNFRLVDYTDSKGEHRPCYALSKMECLYIVFIYYSKDGKQKERTYLVWTPKGAEMIDKMIFKSNE